MDRRLAIELARVPTLEVFHVNLSRRKLSVAEIARADDRIDTVSNEVRVRSVLGYLL